MKNKKKIIKIVCAIMGFVLLSLMITKVDATTYKTNDKYKNTNSSIFFEDIKANSVASDTSLKVATSSIIIGKIMKIYKWGAFICGCIVFINGTKVLIKKKQKRGIIYIVVALFLIWSAIMVDAMDVHDHGI